MHSCEAWISRLGERYTKLMLVSPLYVELSHLSADIACLAQLPGCISTKPTFSIGIHVLYIDCIT